MVNLVRYGPAPIIEKKRQYYGEDFVRGKIENWANRPSGPQRGTGLKSVWVSIQRAAKRGTAAPIMGDPTDAEVTTRTLNALEGITSTLLVLFHTTDRTLKEMARQVQVSTTGARRRLEQGHVDFCEAWQVQHDTYREELRVMHLARTQLADVVPTLAAPRDRPGPGPVTIIKF